MALGFCSKADKQDRWMRYWGVRGFGTRKMANTGTEPSKDLHPLSKLCMLFTLRFRCKVRMWQVPANLH